MDALPKSPGTYLLVLYLIRNMQIEVGRLTTRDFKRGWYAYVGSAFGPGGLAARLRRHLKREKKNHWHIDYLRASAWIKEIWVSTELHSLEHQWALVMKNSPWVVYSVAAFGSSDCRCSSHLFYLKKHPGQDELRCALGPDCFVIPTT
jgi:Uri superfamily endonuclease